MICDWLTNAFNFRSLGILDNGFSEFAIAVWRRVTGCAASCYHVTLSHMVSQRRARLVRGRGPWPIKDYRTYMASPRKYRDGWHWSMNDPMTIVKWPWPYPPGSRKVVYYFMFLDWLMSVSMAVRHRRTGTASIPTIIVLHGRVNK